MAFLDLADMGSEALIVLLGFVIAYAGMRAYRSNKSRSLLAMSLGFIVLILSTLIEEITLQLFHFGMPQAHIFRNLTVAAGLFVVAYSIYVIRD